MIVKCAQIFDQETRSIVRYKYIVYTSLLSANDHAKRVELSVYGVELHRAKDTSSKEISSFSKTTSASTHSHGQKL